jgi:FkbM family methyltransferase
VTYSSLKLYLRVARTFHNFLAVIQAVRKGRSLDSASLRNGLRIYHPPGRDGLVSVLVETWIEEAYTGSGFYFPNADDVVLDIGANVGVFAIYLARQNPECRIIALEPFPENFVYLCRNLEVNRIRNVEPRQLALGARACAAYMVPVGSRSLDHVLRPDPTASICYQVETCDLEELVELSATRRVSLLKMDIEGSEHDVFAQADPVILRRFERIAVEYHDNLRPNTLELIKHRLAGTHSVDVRPSTVPGCGVIRAAVL